MKDITTEEAIKDLKSLIEEYKDCSVEGLNMQVDVGFNEERCENLEKVLNELETYKRLAEQNLKDSNEFKDNMCEHRCIRNSEILELKDELEKKDKIIDAMEEWIGDRCFYSDDCGNSCEIIQDSCYDPVKDCKNCIKQYFEKEVKDE